MKENVFLTVENADTGWSLIAKTGDEEELRIDFHSTIAGPATSKDIVIALRILSDSIDFEWNGRDRQAEKLDMIRGFMAAIPSEQTGTQAS